MLEFCQAETNEATVAVSTDERNVYVYKDDAGNGDIFYSEFQDGRFKDLQPILDNGINRNFLYCNPRNTLFRLRNR